MKRSALNLAFGFTLAAASAAAGCTERTHLTESYARSYRAAVERQMINPTAGRAPRAIAALDTQDAAVIAKTYRRGMAPKGAEGGVQDQPLLMIAPAKNGQPYMPPPSVPNQ